MAEANARLQLWTKICVLEAAEAGRLREEKNV